MSESSDSPVIFSAATLKFGGKEYPVRAIEIKHADPAEIDRCVTIEPKEFTAAIIVFSDGTVQKVDLPEATTGDTVFSFDQWIKKEYRQSIANHIEIGGRWVDCVGPCEIAYREEMAKLGLISLRPYWTLPQNNAERFVRWSESVERRGVKRYPQPRVTRIRPTSVCIPRPQKPRNGNRRRFKRQK